MKQNDTIGIFFLTVSSQMVYLPENETELVGYQYLTKPLDAEKFKNALFSDPSLVQKNEIVSDGKGIYGCIQFNESGQ